jgi:hypothetical protein
MKLPPEMVAKMLATPGVLVNGKPWGVCAPAPVEEEFDSEKEFQAWVVKYAKERGWECFHVFDSRKSAEGFPDLVMLREERQVVAELKMPGKKPTAAQRKWLKLFERVGAETFTWWPWDAERIQEVLK